MRTDGVSNLGVLETRVGSVTQPATRVLYSWSSVEVPTRLPFPFSRVFTLVLHPSGEISREVGRGGADDEVGVEGWESSVTPTGVWTQVRISGSLPGPTLSATSLSMWVAVYDLGSEDKGRLLHCYSSKVDV